MKGNNTGKLKLGMISKGLSAHFNDKGRFLRKHSIVTRYILVCILLKTFTGVTVCFKTIIGKQSDYR